MAAAQVEGAQDDAVKPTVTQGIGLASAEPTVAAVRAGTLGNSALLRAATIAGVGTSSRGDGVRHPITSTTQSSSAASRRHLDQASGLGNLKAGTTVRAFAQGASYGQFRATIGA